VCDVGRLSVLAFDSSYESRTLAAGYRRHASATPAISGGGSVLGLFIGAAIVRDPRAGPPPF
jgi:hypothetical protein